MVDKRLNKDIVEYRIQPYIKEASIQLILEIIIIGVVVIVFLIAGFSVAICTTIIVGYIIMALLLHYRIAIQAIIDKRNEDYVTETINIKAFKEEYSFIGDRTGHSYIQYFYPKEMHVQKMKIKVVNANGEKKSLRSVMSFRRILRIAFLQEKYQIIDFKVTYLKRSKILISIKVDGDIDKLLAGKIKKSRKLFLKESIDFIDTDV